MFRKVLIANRGEIACRIQQTLRELGVVPVAVYSEADHSARHVLEADEAVCVGPAGVKESYLDTQAILQAALDSGAEAIHPGYGFLSENAEFAETCEANGIRFIGPTAEQIRAFGLKHTARELAEEADVPLVPGTGLLRDCLDALGAAERIGYPVMLKSTAGGGGIGMKVCADAATLEDAFDAVRRLGQSNFKSEGVFLEKYIAHARHVEVQIFGDGEGNVIALGERDCSTQRRNQKVIEETPAPGLTMIQRDELAACATRLAASIRYRSAGTVEFILDADTGRFYFLEVNTRLQVEHGVTEEVWGVDLVRWMVQLAAGEAIDFMEANSAPKGHSIQVRIYAEDPNKQFQPSSGTLIHVAWPDGVRCDRWIEAGTEVTPFYDPLLAKLIVHAPNREEAVAAMGNALANTRLAGFETNLEYLKQVIASEVFCQGRMTTGSLALFEYLPPTIDVLAGGNFTTVQDWPGRTGYWDVGVPPSGPMDHFSFRLGNRLLGNPEGAAGLECTMTGPTLRFNRAATVCLAGAVMQTTVDGRPIAMWSPTAIPAGATLRMGNVGPVGVRTYLLIRGGLDVPDYLGCGSTFTLGQFGGHAGRAVQTGDVLHLCEVEDQNTQIPVSPLPAAQWPSIANAWEIGVIDGPHAAPDFFREEDIAMFYSTDWEVHFHSARTGVRLIGPKPKWARSDGGEAGLHPSNIHDNAYAVGTVDFTGDMPVILGPDGPSLGGFVCPATIVQGELWKLGQLRPGDTIRFIPVTPAEAARLERDQNVWLKDTERGRPFSAIRRAADGSRVRPIVLESTNERPQIVYRLSGDRYLLIEYGPNVLDLDLRFRTHALMEWVRGQRVPGILDLTPGIRSLQIHYDNLELATGDLLDLMQTAEIQLPLIDEIEVPARIVHLPLSWDDPGTRQAIEKYMQVVRDDAPWCPSNLEFIRRINGLDSVDDVKRIVYEASYLVMGLGDVYLGAPVAVPIDPRHRLVTTKYNPARTWTPENAVGIGGAYMCIYGMEGPGGYQFVGRTVPVWNRYRQTAAFCDGKPWLLRFFDQIRFFPVTHEELMDWRRDVVSGRAQIKIEPTTFRLREYHEFLDSIRDDASACKLRQQQAFDEERARWEATGEFQAAARATETVAGEETELIDLPKGAILIEAPLHANVWQVLAEPGAAIEAGQPLAILEAMKMETPVASTVAGHIHGVLCKSGQMVKPGQTLAVIIPTPEELQE